MCFSPANAKFAERARRFPGLISCTTIDWFLRWPEDALREVSSRFITEDKTFKIAHADKVPEEVAGQPRVLAPTEKNIVQHIANVHNIVTEGCLEYFQNMRRQVYVTPKSYLSFISSYKVLYNSKRNGIDKQERDVTQGLNKLKQAEVDVEKMKTVLEVQTVELQVAEKAANAMLEKLEVSTKDANVKKAEAAVIAEKCAKTAEQIDAEKQIANKELEAAMPFVVAAEKAAKSVNKKDIGIVQKLGKPPDLIKRIMDCVLILMLKPVDKVYLMEIKTGKTETQMFVGDSYDKYAKKVMCASEFIPSLLNFAL